MGAIYKAQTQWQAPDGHKFQAAPIRDYISDGLANLGQAAEKASEGIQLIQNKEAADRMEQASAEAAHTIEMWEDFTGEDYKTRMVASAMKIWDDAYAQMDPATARRFDMNNPEARNVAEFVATKAATNKTFDHIRDQYERLIPTYASRVVALTDPNEIKAEMGRITDYIAATSNMRAADLNKWIDKFQTQVGQGAVSQAVAEGRAEDAASLNMDLEFTGHMTPEQRAKNNIAIQNLLKAQASSASSSKTDVDKLKKEQWENAILAIGRDLINNAGDDPKKREEASLQYAAILNDFANGSIQQAYLEGTGLDPKDMPDYDVVLKISEDAYKAILEKNPSYKQAVNDLSYNISLMYSLADKNNDGVIDPDEVTADDEFKIRGVLKQANKISTFNASTLKQLNDLNNVIRLKRDADELVLHPASNTSAANGVIRLDPWLPSWVSERKEARFPARLGENNEYGRVGNPGQYTDADMEAARAANTDKAALKRRTDFGNDLVDGANAYIQRLNPSNTTVDVHSYRGKTGILWGDVDMMDEETRKYYGLEKYNSDDFRTAAQDTVGQYAMVGQADKALGTPPGVFRPTSLRHSLDDMGEFERYSTNRAYINSTKAGQEFVVDIKQQFGLGDDAIEVLMKKGELPPEAVATNVLSQDQIGICLERNRDPKTGECNVAGLKSDLDNLVRISEVYNGQMPGLRSAVSDAVDGIAKGLGPALLPVQLIKMKSIEDVRDIRDRLEKQIERGYSGISENERQEINAIWKANVVDRLNNALDTNAKARKAGTMDEWAIIMAEAEANRDAAYVAARQNGNVRIYQNMDVESGPYETEEYFLTARYLSNLMGPEAFSSYSPHKVVELANRLEATRGLTGHSTVKNTKRTYSDAYNSFVSTARMGD